MCTATSSAPDAASRSSHGIVARALGVMPMSPKTASVGDQPAAGGVTKEKARDCAPPDGASPTVYV
jgi:hypothetical protein